MSKELDVKVENKLGLHARPAAMVVRSAMGFSSDIFLEKDGDRVNAKSIMGIMGFAACQGTIIKIIADGDDADNALEALSKLFKDKFGED